MGTRTLKDIKVGDRLLIDDDQRQIICTVLKLTPTQVVTDWPWGKDAARFYRGKLSRHNSEPHWRKIGYSGWYGSEIQAIATKAQCEQYDTEKAERERKAGEEAEQRKRKEEHRTELGRLFGDRRVGVYESHHVKDADWTIHLNLTTQGVIKLATLLEALTAEELPSWERQP